MRVGLHAIDLAIILLYFCVLGGIGLYFSRKQQTLHDFIRGGGDKLGWLTLGLSLMAALNSGLDYISAPAVVFGVGMVFIMSWISWILLYPWVSRVTLPFYQKLDVYSAYEYLELRFGPAVRTVAAGIFILWRIGWMGAAIYVPCLAVKAATGGRLDIPTMVIPLGLIVTFYTMLGGMRAVIWTDVAQFCIMFGGLAGTLGYIVSQIPGGFSELMSVAGDAGRLDLWGRVPEGSGIAGFFTTEVTAIGITLSVALGRAAAFTADQIAIQRFQSSRSLGEARSSFVVNAVTDTIWMVALGFVGLALFAFYQHHPLPAGMQNDRVLPYFMLTHFPSGLTGLVIAAIFAASLSSVDSALNSTTSVVMVDFYNRLKLGRRRPEMELPPEEERRQLVISRAVNLAVGLLMLVVATNIERMGEIYSACNKILGAFFGPLFGIFVLGMFVRRCRSVDALVGAFAGLCASCFVSFFSAIPVLQSLGGSLFGDGFVDFFMHLSWTWPAPTGITTAVLAGALSSFVLPGRRQEEPLTFAEVMRRK